MICFLLAAINSGGMQYQLVVQIRSSDSNLLDAILELEDQVTEVLADGAEVDGHDFGSDEANLFILTNSPSATFDKILPLLTDTSGSIPAAYRSVNSDEYIRLWPVGYNTPFRIG